MKVVCLVVETKLSGLELWQHQWHSWIVGASNSLRTWIFLVLFWWTWISHAAPHKKMNWNFDLKSESEQFVPYTQHTYVCTQICIIVYTLDHRFQYIFSRNYHICHESKKISLRIEMVGFWVFTTDCLRWRMCILQCYGFPQAYEHICIRLICNKYMYVPLFSLHINYQHVFWPWLNV